MHVALVVINLSNGEELRYKDVHIEEEAPDKNDSVLNVWRESDTGACTSTLARICFGGGTSYYVQE